MKDNIPYLHVLDGRIRIKIPQVKGTPFLAHELEQTLRNIAGVTHVKANPMTGNILILFDSNMISSTKILEEIKQLSSFEKQPDLAQRTENRLVAHNQDSSPGIGSKLAEIFLMKAAECAMEQLIFALV